jgi:hypothetical protein
MTRNTKADLARRCKELEAQLVSTAKSALRDMPKAGDTLTASAVILELTALGGRRIIAPVAIRDGLSAAAIEALKADILRSIDLATL